MSKIIYTGILGLLSGAVGTFFGGLVGLLIKVKSNKIIAYILCFTAGLMIAIVNFDLIPEAIQYGERENILFGVIFGIMIMTIINIIIKYKIVKKKKIRKNFLLKTSLMVAIGMIVHNFPEGFIIGTLNSYSEYLGIKVAVSILIHDLLEGIIIAIPLKHSGFEIKKVIKIIILAGISTGIGAIFGIIAGEISMFFITLSLATASGAMLYIVFFEMIPESIKLNNKKINSILIILGIIIGKYI